MKMKIVVVSDSHGKKGILDEIYNQHQDADMFLHCGDILEDEYHYPEYITVQGNNDLFYDYPMHRIINVGEHKIYMAQSHQFSYFKREEQMVKTAKQHQCDIFCFGHTHIAYDKVVDGVRLINPGSVFRSRDGKGPSYAIMNIDGMNVDVQFIFLKKA